ncbi:MAG TPA: TonB-dependent receptor [Terriglobales bacterium]|nr:TonB-dependent receptor [Terriglobales bacterium]
MSPANRWWARLGTLTLVCLACNYMPAQMTTGSIGGTVVDATDAVIPSADISLVSEGTGATRKTISGGSGEFLFTAVQPGTYTVSVEKTGFRALKFTGISLTASQRLSLGSLKLEVGEVAQSVTVTQTGEAVNVESADTTGLVTDKQMDSLVIRGRDVMNLLRILPGVNTIPMSQGGESTAGDSFSSTQSLGGNVGSFTPTVSGARLDWNNTMVDGQQSSNSDWQGLAVSPVSIEAIAEVKVIANNYTAEYGRNMGSTIQIVSKSGSQEFHGTAYWYHRHEDLDANDFFNNRSGLKKPLYRFTTLGGAVGGPVYIPHLFNQSKTKLFFFYSEEDWRSKLPSAVGQWTLPTALERQGDFSQTLDQGGRLIAIKDPANGGSPFPNNMVPKSRINPNGQALLNVFPMPNILNQSITGGFYNYQFQESITMPKRLQALRLDYHPSDKDVISVTPRRFWVRLHGYNQTRAFSGPPLLLADHKYSVDNVMVKWTHILSPHLVNEVSAGMDGDRQSGQSDRPDYFQSVQRSTIGFGLGQFFPSANPHDIMPQMSFGGVPDAPNVSVDGRLPVSRAYERFQFSEAFSANFGKHALKFGVDIERNWATDGPASPAWEGRFDFSRDVNNPYETNWAFSNAILGYFRSYTESSAKSNYRAVDLLAEWYAQDVWKLTSRLTLTYGLRFSRALPWRLQIGQGIGFDSSKYSLAQESPLYQPALDSGGARVGRNPVTGQLVPALLIGAFVPGVGTPYSGIVSASSMDNGFILQRPMQFAPRFGFAYDVFGNAKTALRGGFGVAKEPQSAYGYYGGESGLASNQPLITSPQIFYGTMATLLSQTGYIFPSTEQAFDPRPKVPSIYHYSFGVQQALPSQMVLDVSYVGYQARHLLASRNLNTLPYGARFLPQNADPTAPSRALPDAFLYPYFGYTSLGYFENSASGNYNGLQVGLNRRFSHGVLFGFSYTWSKAMGYGSGDFDSMPMYNSNRSWVYGPTYFDQTQMFMANYVWTLPKLSKLLPNPVIHQAFDNWEFSGITNFSSGLPQTVGLSTTDNADITGGGDGTRTVIVGAIPTSNPGLYKWFNTAAFARPPQGYRGNAPLRPFRGPGVNNFDLNLMKSFPLWSEGRYLQFLAEFNNAFNHTQYQTVNSTATFNPAGQQVNALFGQVTAARAPRVIQLAIRLTF